MHFLELTKPTKLMRVLASAGFGVLIALPVPDVVWPRIAAAVLAGMLAASGGNALNQYLERDLDASIESTRGRPLVTGVVRPWSALLFAMLCIVCAIAVMAVFVGALATALTLSGIALYIAYTSWLKTSTPLHTVVAGAVWAAAVLVTWVAAGKAISSVPLFAFVFVACWTALHTWSAGLTDYERRYAPAVRFLPRVYGVQNARIAILSLTAVLAIVAAFLERWPALSISLPLVAVALGACMLKSAVWDRLVMRGSIAYLAVYICMLAENAVLTRG